MAISFVAAGTVGTGTNPTAAVPAGIQKDDLLLIVTSGSATPTTPTGWTQLNAQGAGQFITVLFKFATASETNVSLTQTGTSSKAVMVAYRGAGGVEVRPAFATGTGTTATPNTVTTTYSNDYVISLYACAITATTWTANGSTTSRVNSAATASVVGLLIADELQAAAGTSTARGATLSVSRAWSSFAIAIIEAPRALYWVGGNGTWDASSTTNWANSSGGSSGVVAPTLVDNAFIDGSSGSPAVTISGALCASLTTTGATCSIEGATAITGLNINGSMTLSATTTWTTTARNLNFVGTGTITTNGVTVNSPIAFNGVSQTFTLGGNLNAAHSGTLGSVTLTAGTLNLSTFALNVVTFAASETATRSITFGSGSAINVSGSGTISSTWGCATATGFSTTGTPTVNFTGAVPTIVHATTGGSETTGRVDFNISSSGTITFTTASRMRNLNFTGATGSFTPPAALTVYGDLTIVSGMTWTTGTGTITFASTSSGKTITTAGKTLYDLTFNGSGGGWTLQDTLNISTAADITVTNGTFNTGNYTINGGGFLITASGATVNLGSSTLNLQAPSAPWSCVTAATLNAGTSNIVITGTTNIFNGGNKTYYNVSFPGDTTNTINDDNTFNKISFNGSVTGSGTLEFDAGGNNTIGTFDIRGTAGNLPIISSQSTSQTTLTSLNNAIQSNIDYIQVNDVTFAPTPTSTGTVPYYWYIGQNSAAGADTVGGLFTSDTTYTYYELSSGTSWTVPANWGSLNNVYLFGAGGGGSGSVVASSTGSHNSGSGGGGGGFTALTNVSLTPSGSVTYAIGAAGSAGSGSTSSSTGGTGGTTSFSSGAYTAGGGGGASTGLGTATPGTAGTGTTTNGGTGGSGTAPNTNTSNAGGGGAGGGGLDGNGQNGGNNSGTTVGAGGAGNNAVSRHFLQSLNNSANGNFRYGRGEPGGGTTSAGAAATGFGGGGSGGGTLVSSATTRAGGAGTQGLIVIRHIPGSTLSTGKFFQLFYP